MSYKILSYVMSEAKKKKSSFRITSIIDPIKNDNSDEKEDSDSANEGVEDALPASRFRMIPIQRPNPTTYNSGRWKVKEIYVVHLKEEGKARPDKPKPTSAQSVTSNESIGDNARSVTPASDTDRYTTHSSESIDNIIISAPSDTALPNTAGSSAVDNMMESLRFGDLEEQVRLFDDRVRGLVESLHLQLSTANNRHEDLLRNYRALEEENARLKEQVSHSAKK